MKDHYQSADYTNAANIKKALLDVMVHEIGRDPEGASSYAWYNAVAEVIRRKMGENLVKTERTTKQKQAKQMFYLSMEYLLGQSMYKRLTDLGMDAPMREALSEFGVNLDELIYDIDSDAALGNGGLGRLAACFLILLPPMLIRLGVMVCVTIMVCLFKISKTVYKPSAPKHGCALVTLGSSRALVPNIISNLVAVW